MKQALALSSLILVLAVSYCGRHLFSSQSPLLGEYQLLAHDQSGQLVFTGTISLTSLEQNHLKGQCTIVREKNAPEGLLDEAGACEGLIDGKTVNIDSAPSLDDAGLLFEGQFNDDRIIGVWKIDGFVTSPPLGKFEAAKKR